jgi:hypothetical protein
MTRNERKDFKWIALAFALVIAIIVVGAFH